MSSIWISNSISNWTAQSQGGEIFESEWERAYLIWEHARRLVDGASDDFNLADGVANLKKALNHRLKLIERMYSFKSIEIPNKPKGYLELLERYDIVRPHLMKILLNIRNNIEHNDATPPDNERCKEFVDVVWYFLKSTDSITQIRPSNPAFNLLDETGLETQYWYQADIDFEKSAKIEIYGWFPSDIIYTTAQDETSIVNAKRLGTKKSEWDSIKKRRGGVDEYLIEDFEKRIDSDIYLTGELLPTPGVRLALIKKLLTCY